MDLTETPEGIPEAGEAPPNFEQWKSPSEVLQDGSTRERLLDVVMQIREPTKVSAVAERADCDTETARDYLEWFSELGLVRELSGRPVQYERNESYLQWRRIERIRDEYSQSEIVEQLKQTLEAVSEYRQRFEAETPDDVSLVEASRGDTVEDVWEAVSTWQTLEQRAALLDAARREESASGRTGRVDA